MKRTIALLLCLSMLMPLAACKGDGTPAASTTTVTEETSSSSSEEVTTASSEEDNASYCESGILKGLKIEENNTFVNTDEKYSEFISNVKDIVAKSFFAGSMIIATDDEIIMYTGPKALSVTGDPVDPYTTYDIASCSKLFTATAVFQLIEEGKLSLEDTLDKFFPEYEAGKDITLFNVLHMTSGIVDYYDTSKFWAKVDGKDRDEIARKSERDEISDEEFLDNLYAAPLNFKPGTSQEYSNTNYVILALIVEQVSGMRFCDYLKKNIFDVCGLENTTSMVQGNETCVPKDFENIYKLGLVDETGRYMAVNRERGCGGIHTGVADLLTFDRALLGGKLVSSESFDDMTTWSFADKMGYGCGLFTYGSNAFGHSGYNATCISQNIIIDSKEFGRVYLVASTSSEKLGNALMMACSQIQNTL